MPNTVDALSVPDAIKVVALTAHILRIHGENLRNGVEYPAHLTPNFETVADALDRVYYTLVNHEAHD